MLKSILILDTESGELLDLCAAFRSVCPDAEVATVASQVELERALSAADPDLLVLDQDLGDGRRNGLEIVRWLRHAHPDLPVVVVAEQGGVEAARKAVEAGATDYLVRRHELRDRVTTQLEKIRRLVALVEKNSALARENRTLRDSLQLSHTIVGDSPEVQRVLELVRRVAKVPRPVLIVGERGTGKELVARAIHEASGRSGPFVVVNSAGLSDNLLDSELFGHERGAFTGAERLALGKFETANQGTLFLDEIGNMPLSFQKKILRAVEYGKFLRVGGSHEIRVETRIIAATNADLTSKIERGEFLADLYDRLAFEVIRVPALRDRKGDLPVLAQHFLEQFVREVPAFAGKRLAPEALRALAEYPFPGNLRELKNVIERAVYRETGDELSLDDIELPRELTVLRAGSFKQRVEDLERELVQGALRDAQGNQTQAARALGLTYAQFRYYLAKHSR